MPTLVNRASLVLGLALVCGGCAPTPSKGGVVPLKDMHVGGEEDGGESDGGDVDLSGAGGRHWTDESSPGVDGGNLWSAFNDGAGTVVIAGDYGRVLRSTGHAPFIEDASLKPAKPALLSVAAVGPLAAGQPLYLAGLGGAMWKYKQGNFADATGAWAPDAPQTGNDLYAVWVAPDGVTFAVGSAVAIKRSSSDDSTGVWSLVGGGPGPSEAAYGLWGTKVGAGYSIYAVGAAGKIWHSTGDAYTPETSGTTSALYAVWGASAGDIYAVGDVGVILHSTGNGTWTQQNAGQNLNALEGIGGASANEIYVVGDPDKTGNSVLLHKRVASSDIWFRETLASPTEDRFFFGVSATSTDVYLVGGKGAILHK